MLSYQSIDSILLQVPSTESTLETWKHFLFYLWKNPGAYPPHSLIIGWKSPGSSFTKAPGEEKHILCFLAST
jgi:hypothetical protein